MARLRASQAFGVKPVRGADRKSAPERQHKDVLSLGEGPKPEKRKWAVCAIRGVFSLPTFSWTSKRK